MASNEICNKNSKNKKKKRIAAVCCAGMLLSCLYTGCGKGDPLHVTQMMTKPVLKVDGESYSLSEAKVYLVNYQNLYGTVAGVDLWQREDQVDMLEEYIKNLTIAQMTKILSMDSLAKSRNIALEEEELASVAKAAKAYYESLNEEELAYLEVGETEIRKLYEDYALAQKLYKSLTVGVNSEVSDDEARIMDAMQIVVSDAKKAREIKKALKSGGDFSTLAGSYNEAEEIKIQFGRGELPQEVEKAAFALDNGTASGSIKTDDGFYFIYCVNKFNEELTDANKIKIVQKREKEAFGDVYDAYSRTIAKKMYQDTWNSLQANRLDQVKTDSFFAVYQEYCSEL
ncbi:Foldase protein PrsA [Eubacterium plexicaudatum ASF492]|uniref:peptidylprolyl isomerase n=1 Tax=Eubacterium plexicaudatum ASF492 TaxID=1235802 RepID=N2ACB1_9FIRM|nr:Foldase protein PrsA [Eubacterium plexicaudatum ASF492]